MMKIVSNCPLCEENALHVIEEDGIGTQQCISCGYATTSKFIGTKETNETYKTLPEEMQSWCVITFLSFGSLILGVLILSSPTFFNLGKFKLTCVGKSFVYLSIVSFNNSVIFLWVNFSLFIYIKDLPTQVNLNLPKLKKVGDDKIKTPKIKLPKLKKVITHQEGISVWWK